MDKKKVVLIVIVLVVYTIAVVSSSIAIYASHLKREQKKEAEKTIEEYINKGLDGYAQNAILNQITQDDEQTNIDTSSPEGWKNILPDSFVNSTNGFMDSILNK